MWLLYTNSNHIPDTLAVAFFDISSYHSFSKLQERKKSYIRRKSVLLVKVLWIKIIIRPPIFRFPESSRNSLRYMFWPIFLYKFISFFYKRQGPGCWRWDACLSYIWIWSGSIKTLPPLLVAWRWLPEGCGSPIEGDPVAGR